MKITRKITKKVLIAILVLITVNISFAGDNDNILELNGVVFEVPDVMDGCNIIVHQNGVPTVFTKSDQQGKYSLKLSLGNQYIIEFSYPGFISKKISVDAEANVDKSTSYLMNDLVVDLFQELKSESDVSLLQQPIAKINFNPSTGSLEYDTKYNNNIQKKVQELWNTVYNERISRDENYTIEMSIADSNFYNKNYVTAKHSYLSALSYRPMAIEPKEKIKVIDELLKTEEVVEQELSTLTPVEFYSDKIMENKYTVGRKIITVRNISNEANKQNKYRMVETAHGTYYFKNNTPITSVVWELETSNVTSSNNN